MERTIKYNINRRDYVLDTQSKSFALIDLFTSGLYWLQYLEKDKECIKFTDWKNLLIAARPNDSSLDDRKLIWLWESITTEPSLKDKLGNKIVSLDDEWKDIEPFECLPQNSSFGIFLRGFQSYGYPAVKRIDGIKPDAEAEISEPLLLRPGKAQRLECCDVPTALRIKLSGNLSSRREALAFKVSEKDIKILGNTVEVSVKSLNHAFTKASLRLQPNRRGHGGKAYYHVALKVGDTLFEPLEEVRKKSEKRIWNKLKGV